MLVVISILFILTSCAECKTAAQCEPREGFDAFCYEGSCAYEPKILGCGNDWCEANENICSCPEDCPQSTCQGSVGKYFEKTCYQQKCVVDVSKTEQKTQAMTLTEKIGKDLFRANFKLNNPFNLKRDSLNVELLLDEVAKDVLDRKIQRMRLTAKKDKQEIVLSEIYVNKPLWSSGSDFAIEEELIISSESRQIEVSDLRLLIDYTYKTSKGDLKQNNLVFKLKELKLVLLKPEVEYACPKPCPAKKGYDSSCNTLTSRCEFKPMPDSVGNFICESGENSCSSPKDCGPCEKTLEFVQFTCVQNSCVGEIRSDVNVEKISLFDDNKRTGFRLHNIYNYNNPFNAFADKLSVDFTLFEKDDEISQISVDKILVLEQNQQLAIAEPKLLLKSINEKKTVELQLPKPTIPEEEKTLTLQVFYSVTKKGKKQAGEYKKSLQKLIIVNTE